MSNWSLIFYSSKVLGFHPTSDGLHQEQQILFGKIKELNPWFQAMDLCSIWEPQKICLYLNASRVLLPYHCSEYNNLLLGIYVWIKLCSWVHTCYHGQEWLFFWSSQIFLPSTFFLPHYFSVLYIFVNAYLLLASMSSQQSWVCFIPLWPLILFLSPEERISPDLCSPWYVYFSDPKYFQ